MVISPLVNCALATENLVDLLQVVELDGVVGDVAKRHFGFVENERMQVLQRAPHTTGVHIGLIKNAFWSCYNLTSQQSDHGFL